MAKYVSSRENHVLYLDDSELSLVLNKLEKLLIDLEKQAEERVEKIGKEREFSYSDEHFIAERICAAIREISPEELHDIIEERVKEEQIKEPIPPVSMPITVNVPHAFIKFGGFSIARDVKRFFPEDEKVNFDIIIPGSTVYKAHRSQVSRIKIVDGIECFRRLNVKPNDKLEIEIIEPLKRYRILKVIPASWNYMVVKFEL